MLKTMAYLRNHLVLHPLLFEALSTSHYSTTQFAMSRKESSPNSGTRTLWIDTDVGFDDLLAISSLECRSNIQISLLTTVGGMQSNPAEIASFLQAEFAPTTVIPGLVPLTMQHGKSSIPSWLQDTRQQLKSLYPQPSTEKSSLENSLDTEEGQNQLNCFLTSHEDRSVDLLCLGPLTNIALCLDNNNLTDLMHAKIHQVWIMGGNNPCLSSEPEFNFATDPQATAVVLETLQDRIFVVPSQTCQIQKKDTTIKTTWDRLTTMAANSERHTILQRVFRTNPDFSSLKYDVICAFAYYRPDDVTIEQIEIRVDSSSGLLELSPQEDYQGYNFVTDFPLKGESGFFHWLQEAITR